MSNRAPSQQSTRGGAPERRPVLKIILLGDSGVGKTSLMRQFVSGKFESRYKATIGADFFTHEEVIDGRPVNLQIWDTAGQERFQSLGSAFYRGADACMIVFDITSNESFSHITTWLQEFTLQAGPKEMVLIGNKSDIQDRRQVYNRGIVAWCQEHNQMPYVETSAKNNHQVAAAFRTVATAAYRAKVAKQGEEPVPVMAGSIKTLRKEEDARGKEDKQSDKKCAC